jgi:hypothetical protein
VEWNVREDRGRSHQVEGVVLTERQGRLELVHVELDPGHMIPRPRDLRSVDVRADESQVSDAAKEPNVLRCTQPKSSIRK